MLSSSRCAFVLYPPSLQFLVLFKCLYHFSIGHLIEVSMRAKESRDSESLITRKSENVLGLKRDLVRLIGNLCYKNKENQDKVSLYMKFYPATSISLSRESSTWFSC